MELQQDILSLPDSIDNSSQNYMDTHSVIPCASDFTFESFMTEISDTIPGPSIDTGDDLVNFIERFTNEIQEPPTNQMLSSPPILQPDNSQFLLANIVGHGSTSDLLEPLLSPECETEKLLSDVLFQESDPCTHSNSPNPYPECESQELIPEPTADVIMENNSVSNEDNEQSNGTKSDCGSEETPPRVTRSRTSQVKQEKSVVRKKPVSKPWMLPPKYNTRSSSKYSIKTRSSRSKKKFDSLLKTKLFSKQTDLKCKKKTLRQSESKGKIEKCVNKNRENKQMVLSDKVNKNISKEKENEKDKTEEIGTEIETKVNTSLDTNSNSRMLDVKITLVPISPRTPKGTTTPSKQLTLTPNSEPTNQLRRKLTSDDTYNRFIPPLPVPPQKKRGRPRKHPVPLYSPPHPLTGRKVRRSVRSDTQYVLSSSDNSDSDNSYKVRTNRPKLYNKRIKPSILPQSSADEASEDDIITEDTPLTSYSIYRPSRLRFGYPHPDPIVETTSLSSVQSPNIWFDLSLPTENLSSGCLSDMQLEAVVYACQQHCNILSNGDRAGFLIGDGAGVGKGRIIAGIIHQNYLEGRKKGVWLSVSNDLRYDAMRDLRDIGANRVVLHPLNKFKYGKISGKRNGHVKKGIIFSTYSSLISGSSAKGKYRTRLSQILRWLGPHFDGVIVLDECHRAKNLYPTSASMKPSKTGNVILELQRRLPKARIVYCSATGASEVKHLAYMVRLGLWGNGTQFQTFHEFNRAVEKGGVGAMELVAMDMKLRGLYISRQLSFTNVHFQIQEIPLTQAYIEVYNTSCGLWIECKKKFLEAMKLLDFDNRKFKVIMALFWAAHQRFFKYLCIASKVQGAVRIVKQAIRENKCVVIGLQSTGESRLMDVLEEKGGELSEFVSSAKGVLVNLIQKHFPAPYVKSKVTHEVPDKPGELSDSTPGSNPEKDSALDSDNSNTDLSEVNWETVPPLDYEDSTYRRYISSSDTTDGEDMNPFAEGSVPWIANKKTKKLKLEMEDSTTPQAEHSSPIPVAKQPELKKRVRTDPRDVYQRTKDMKQELLDKVEEISVFLPNNTLDELIDCLGGPNQVSEMTGRKGRVVTETNVTAEIEPGIKYELRSCLDVPIDLLNMEEKRKFMDGEVNIAIISEAASSGISLHADKRYKNQKQRLHITLELPWTADKAIQQFGRTHRSNQVVPPQYLFLISELAGERRFASVIARRLENLGALTRGDRKAAGVESSDFTRFNFDTRDGLLALDSLLRCLVGKVSPLASSLSSANEERVRTAIEALITVELISRTPKGKLKLDRELLSVSKFLNRLLGIEVELQNTIFIWFLDTFDFLVRQAKRLGRWDDGIVEMGTTAGEEVERIRMEEFLELDRQDFASTVIA